MSACYCVGPQNGQPVCPCQMRNVHVENGRYVRNEDLGPVETEADRQLLDGWREATRKPILSRAFDPLTKHWFLKEQSKEINLVQGR